MARLLGGGGSGPQDALGAACRAAVPPGSGLAQDRAAVRLLAGAPKGAKDHWTGITRGDQVPLFYLPLGYLTGPDVHP